MTVIIAEKPPHLQHTTRSHLSKMKTTHCAAAMSSISRAQTKATLDTDHRTVITKIGLQPAHSRSHKFNEWTDSNMLAKNQFELLMRIDCHSQNIFVLIIFGTFGVSSLLSQIHACMQSADKVDVLAWKYFHIDFWITANVLSSLFFFRVVRT